MSKTGQRKEVENLIPDGTTKGELMELVYSEKELSSIDASLPSTLYETKINNNFWLVMNYNDNVLGEIQDMRDVLIQNKMLRSEYQDQISEEVKKINGNFI